MEGLRTKPPTPGKSGPGVRWGREQSRSCAAAVVAVGASAVAVVGGDTAGHLGHYGEDLRHRKTWLNKPIQTNHCHVPLCVPAVLVANGNVAESLHLYSKLSPFSNSDNLKICFT